MVELAGITAVSVGDARVAAITRTPAAAPVVAAAEQAAPAVAGLTRTMAASAPVDGDRVAEIRRAIAEGTYPILPETVADRLIALKLEWNPDDQA